MENIKESLIMAMLENQCRILAKIQSLERRFDAEMIIKYGNSETLIEQFRTIDGNIETDTKKFIQETYDRAEKINKELNRDPHVFQDL